MRLRGFLGFESAEHPIEALVAQVEERSVDQVMNSNALNFAFAEVCCLEESCLNLTCVKLDIPYLGIAANMQKDEVFQKCKRHIQRWKKQGLHVHVHISTPCTVGSPLKHFNKDSDDSEVEKAWLEIMTCAPQYLLLGDTRSFELPGSNVKLHLETRRNTSCS